MKREEEGTGLQQTRLIWNQASYTELTVLNTECSVWGGGGCWVWVGKLTRLFLLYLAQWLLKLIDHYFCLKKSITVSFLPKAIGITPVSPVLQQLIMLNVLLFLHWISIHLKAHVYLLSTKMLKVTDWWIVLKPHPDWNVPDMHFDSLHGLHILLTQRTTRVSCLSSQKRNL